MIKYEKCCFHNYVNFVNLSHAFLIHSIKIIWCGNTKTCGLSSKHWYLILFFTITYQTTSKNSSNMGNVNTKMF